MNLLKESNYTIFEFDVRKNGTNNFLNGWIFFGNLSFQIINLCYDTLAIVGGYGVFTGSSALNKFYDNLPTHYKLKLQARVFGFKNITTFQNFNIKLDNLTFSSSFFDSLHEAVDFCRINIFYNFFIKIFYYRCGRSFHLCLFFY